MADFILTPGEIKSLLGEMRQPYKQDWNESLVPFAYVRGVGDVIAFDLDQRNAHGLALVVDGFHELSPPQ